MIHETFDFVIVTTAPVVTRALFQDTTDDDLRGEIEWLFSEESCPTVFTRSFLINASGTDELKNILDTQIPSPELVELGFAPDEESTHHLGFLEIDPFSTWITTDPTSAEDKITACNLQNHGSLWMCFASCGDSKKCVGANEAWEVAKHSTRTYFKASVELVEHRLSNWPRFPSAKSVRKGWYDRLDSIQGKDNIFSAGEIVSGPILEMQVTFVEGIVPIWFANCLEGPSPSADDPHCKDSVLKLLAAYETRAMLESSKRFRHQIKWSSDRLGSLFADGIVEVAADAQTLKWIFFVAMILSVSFACTHRVVTRALAIDQHDRGSSLTVSSVVITHYVIQAMTNLVIVVPYTKAVLILLYAEPEYKGLIWQVVEAGRTCTILSFFHFLLIAADFFCRMNCLPPILAVHHMIYFMHGFFAYFNGTTFLMKGIVIFDYFICWEFGTCAALVLYKLRPHHVHTSLALKVGAGVFALTRVIQCAWYVQLAVGEAAQDPNLSSLSYWAQNVVFCFISVVQIKVILIHLSLSEKSKAIAGNHFGKKFE